MATDLQREVDGMFMRMQNRVLIPGRLGRQPTDTTLDIRVSGQPNWYHVRVGPDGEERTFWKAFALNVPPRPNMPVLIERKTPTLPVIIGADWSRMEEYLGTEEQVYNVSTHTHRTGTGLEYEVEAEHFAAGRVRPYSGMKVWINPFRHTGGYWPGGILDLTSNKPATSGNHAWVLVGVDTATNTAVAVTGDEYSYASPLTPDLIEDVTWSNEDEPLTAVKVRQDDTTLEDIRLFQDAHRWFDAAGVTDPDAIHDNVASEISAITEKVSPVNADLVIIEDSADSNNKKRVQVGNLPGAAGGYTEGARVYNSSNISIPHNTITALTYDSERYDTDTIHSTVSNTGRLTATTAGKYIITAHVAFAANATGARTGNIRVNGTTIIGEQRINNLGGALFAVLSVPTIYDLAASDYVECTVYQNSGGALNVVVLGNYSPEFAMQRIG